MTKPIPLRIIFLSNALMMVLPFVFYGVVTSRGITIQGLDPVWMLYTGAAYIVSFPILVSFILRKNMTGFRAMFAVNALIALPTKAYIGIAIAALSALLSLNNKVVAYFQARSQ